VPVEANLSGTIVVTANDDRPGVIGDIGTMFGRHGVNIASFALGRSGSTAVGVITVDEGVGLQSAVDEVRGLKAIREATIARV
jgi:D-3-phosphoglycerate dehydrogenase